MKKYKLVRTAKTWSIKANGIIIEGGFFSKEAGMDALKQYELTQKEGPQ